MSFAQAVILPSAVVYAATLERALFAAITEYVSFAAMWGLWDTQAAALGWEGAGPGITTSTKQES